MKPMDLVRCALIPAALMALSCTKTEPIGPSRNPQANGPKPGSNTVGIEQNHPEGAASGAANGPRASVPVAVPRSAINRDVNLANLTFTVKYAGVVRTGPVKAEGNKITMTIADLPIGQKGDFILSLEESGAARYVGTTKDVELKAGDNVIDITLVPATQNPPPTNDPTKLSFARDVKPLLEKSCGECHHAGKSLDVTAYPQVADVSAWVDKIIARSSGPQANMPPQPRDPLDQASIQRIQQWKTEGLQQ